MAGKERRAAPDLTRLEGLGRDPTSYGFYRAMRMIEASFDDRPRLGETHRPAQDGVRLGQEAEMAFPPSTIADFRVDEDGRAHLDSRFFGLFGPSGPLPLHLTEYARDRNRNSHDKTFIAFANMFHHRMLSLFWRAWAAGEPAVSFDREDADPFADYVSSFAGLMGPGFHGRDRMPDLSKLHFAGRLGCFRRNEDGLLAIVSAFFRTRTEIVSFVGSWLDLEPDDRWRLGSTAQLGRTASVGGRVWSRQAKFRLRLGPMPLEEYRRLLPGGGSLGKLVAIVRNYAGDEFDWDLNLVLKSGETPKAQLGVNGRLGWTTWIGDRPEGADADDLNLAPLTAA